MATLKNYPSQFLHNPADVPKIGFFRLSQILQLLPISRATVWRKVKAGTFPKPVKLSRNITAWKVADVRDWIEKTAHEG